MRCFGSLFADHFVFLSALSLRCRPLLTRTSVWQKGMCACVKLHEYASRSDMSDGDRESGQGSGDGEGPPGALGERVTGDTKGLETPEERERKTSTNRGRG